MLTSEFLEKIPDVLQYQETVRDCFQSEGKDISIKDGVSALVGLGDPPGGENFARPPNRPPYPLFDQSLSPQLSFVPENCLHQKICEKPLHWRSR